VEIAQSRSLPAIKESRRLHRKKEATDFTDYTEFEDIHFREIGEISGSVLQRLAPV
jgi:hypothetical protein